jgi:predicted RNA methylase
MIASTWNEMRSLLISSDGDAVAARYANLAIAAAMTVQTDHTVAWTAVGLKAAIFDIARHTLLPSRSSETVWKALAELADRIPSCAPTIQNVDEWVEAFQNAGSSRKELGAFATPAAFAKRLAADTLVAPIKSKPVRIVDPACGAGALLVACLDVIAPRPGKRRIDAVHRLHGVELDPDARELCCLLLWMFAGNGASLQVISENIKCGNAVTVDWWSNNALFDVLIMNPPWESLRHKSKDDAQYSDERDATVARIGLGRDLGDGLPKLFSAQGRGDRNLFKVFLELAPHILKPSGRIGMLVPSAFASDDGMAQLRRLYLDYFALDRWTSFENRGKYFSIDSRYKFGILTGTRNPQGTAALATRAFAIYPEETESPHVVVSREDLLRMGGEGAMILEVSSTSELAVLNKMLSTGVPFFDAGELGPLRYRREVDLSLGRAKGHFEALGDRDMSWADGTMTINDQAYVPIVEGRMVGQFDCFQKSWVSGVGRKAVWRDNSAGDVAGCRPQYVAKYGSTSTNIWRVALCDVTSSTNTRTVLATIVPAGWICGNTAPTLNFSSEDSAYAAVAVLNSMTFDWMARRIVSGLHLNKFYLDRFSWPRLDKADVAWLAELGRALSHLMGRGDHNHDNSVDFDIDIIDGLAQIEIITASKFGLRTADMELIYDTDQASRRGFWRYIRSSEYGASVVASVNSSISREDIRKAA